MHDLELVTLRVDATAAHCFVALPFSSAFDWDLKSGVIERIVKDYKFRLDEFPSAEDATVEFCRRFAAKTAFKELFHPELSVRRYFDRPVSPPR